MGTIRYSPQRRGEHRDNAEKRVGKFSANPRRSLRLCGEILALAFLCSAAVVDRVAVVVGNTVFTESEVLQAVRLTEFVNGDPLDLGPKARRDAADHLVDQQLLRDEIELEHFTPPPASDADRLMSEFRHQRFHTTPLFQAALRKYGVTEDELKKYLLWQETALRFTDMRFRTTLPRTTTQTANRLRPGAVSSAKNVDEQLDQWLKDARANTRVVFKQEAFQ